MPSDAKRPRIALARTNRKRGTPTLSISCSITARPLARLRSFGGADFWRLWYAGLIAFFIRWMETLAVAVFVFQRTHSPFLVAMLTMLRILPMGLFGSLIGVWAERVQRRTGLVIMILLLGVTDIVLAALAASGRLTIWQIALGSFVNGVGWAADNPVRRVAMGEVAGSGRMGTAMSIDVAANNAARIFGPVVGGSLLAFASIESVFALGAALYATSLVAALTLGYRNHAAYKVRGSGTRRNRG